MFLLVFTEIESGFSLCSNLNATNHIQRRSCSSVADLNISAPSWSNRKLFTLVEQVVFSSLQISSWLVSRHISVYQFKNPKTLSSRYLLRPAILWGGHLNRLHILLIHNQQVGHVSSMATQMKFRFLFCFLLIALEWFCLVNMYCWYFSKLKFRSISYRRRYV